MSKFAAICQISEVTMGTRWEVVIKKLMDSLGNEKYYYFNKGCLEDMVETHLDWERTRNIYAPLIPKGYRLYKAKLPGVINILPISELPEGSVLVVDSNWSFMDELYYDIPETVYLRTTDGREGKRVDTSYLVTRMVDGEEEFVDLFPGKPFNTGKTRFEKGTFEKGTTFTREEALAMGIEWAFADQYVHPSEEEEKMMEENAEWWASTQPGYVPPEHRTPLYDDENF